MKLGESVEMQTLVGRRRFVLSGEIRANGALVRCFTPIPPGMTAMDMGRKFPAAILELVSMSKDDA